MRTASSRKFANLLVLVLWWTTTTTTRAQEEDDEEILIHNGNAGPRDRFWRHHAATKSLIYEGVDHFDAIQSCLDDALTEADWNAINTQTAHGIRHASRFYYEIDGNDQDVFLVHLKKAILPIHVKAVQTMAKCARTSLPHLYESRPMYQEWNLDEDPGLGGNCPTHLAPLVGIFMPRVIDQMQQTLELAYQSAEWDERAKRDEYWQAQGDLARDDAIHAPEHVGIRASEHLTYNDFPALSDHTDGSSTVYTMNFAFSDEYQGGEFYIVSKGGNRHVIKPQKYDCLVFLGGKYIHGVQKITGGTREMFSTEFWPYPDSPFGTSLWTNDPGNMAKFIRDCNEEMKLNGTDFDTPCTRAFPTTTPFGLEIEDVRKKYGDGSTAMDSKPTKSTATASRGITAKDPAMRPNRVRPQPLEAIRFRDEKGQEYDLDDFRPMEEEPDFLIPRKLNPGEMAPIRWRQTLNPVDGDEGESFVIGFPPELHQEFLAYVAKSGMMQVAHKILYQEEALVPGEHRIYNLDDGHTWGAMIQGSWNTDMVWLDPADEECFESLLSILRRGGFDKVLDAVGKAFDLEGLMIQGVGAIFLSQYQFSDNMHIDIPGSKGSFYNIIVPVHIPVNDTAGFYVSDAEDDEGKGIIALDPNVGVVLGGQSSHGTGECNYRSKKDFRLSFAIYVADINEENIDLIASDSTSLWPTEGDTEWFVAQRGRLWSKDESRSLKDDKGRKPMTVVDRVNGCTVQECESDAVGKRRQCPKTCRLYLNDDEYYQLIARETLQRGESGNEAPVIA